MLGDFAFRLTFASREKLFFSHGLGCGNQIISKCIGWNRKRKYSIWLPYWKRTWRWRGGIFRIRYKEIIFEPKILMEIILIIYSFLIIYIFASSTWNLFIHMSCIILPLKNPESIFYVTLVFSMIQNNFFFTFISLSTKRLSVLRNNTNEKVTFTKSYFK